MSYRMWLVGYLYSNNGMGTWCWEAAHALADAGEPVSSCARRDRGGSLAAGLSGTVHA